jgi:hypothetical protein
VIPALESDTLGRKLTIEMDVFHNRLVPGKYSAINNNNNNQPQACRNR